MRISYALCGRVPTLVWIFAALVLTASCQSTGPESVGGQRTDALDEFESGAKTQRDDDTIVDDDPDDTSLTHGEPEVCDGWDNDRDGLVDEGTSGQSCELNGQPASMQCVGGDLLCQRCTPNEVRTEACGCGQDRVDVCASDGLWRTGACDGCLVPQAPCGLCGEISTNGECVDQGVCAPGEEMVKHCDTCEDNPDECGIPCLGAFFQCTSSCEWEKITACTTWAELQQQTNNPLLCDEDIEFYESCGLCGKRLVTCDGCFWKRGECLEQGVCDPGAQRDVPCFGEECAEGMAATVGCNDACQWDEPSACVGCPLGLISETITECMPGYQCGEEITRVVCESVATYPVCGGVDQVTIGEEIIYEDSTACSVTCTPGTTRARTDCGVGETGTELCTDQCQWGEGEACHGNTVGTPVCTPGEERVLERSCGIQSTGCYDDYNRIETCSTAGQWAYQGNDGYDCPRCSSTTSSTSRSCKMADGRCGRERAYCDLSVCDYGSYGACEALSSSCVPGTVETSTVSCGPGSCGAEYAVTRRCADSGCSWIETSDRAAACPSCSSGQTQEQSCASGCGTETRTCSSSTCAWGGYGSCELATNACVSGQKEQRPCTATCGLPGTQEFTCVNCAMTATGQCESVNPPECNPGDFEVFTCANGCQSTRQCSNSCSWISAPCGTCQ